MRYAHVDVSPALLAADKIGEAIEDAFMTGRPTIVRRQNICHMRWLN